jgi:hypothetical protein
MVTILFISLSAEQNKLENDWAVVCSQIILRRCPICERDSIVGHGRRRKQAHDQDHDWIPIRRGFCNLCGKTFTFLPRFSPPYTHYSLIARSQALRRYFLEGCAWEAAAPAVKDPDRVADPSTLRRWFRTLDSSQPPFSFLRRTMRAVSQWLSGSVSALPSHICHRSRSSRAASKPRTEAFALFTQSNSLGSVTGSLGNHPRRRLCLSHWPWPQDGVAQGKEANRSDQDHGYNNQRHHPKLPLRPPLNLRSRLM